MYFIYFILISITIFISIACAQHDIIKPSAQNVYIANASRANAVKQAFQIAWDGYKEFAFPNDELHPISKGFGNPRNGWGSSAIDGLDTAIIMDLKPVVNAILDFVPSIEYGKTDELVSLFETTIRYIGGMLSAYDLLHDGPKSYLVDKHANVDALLSQSKILADAMRFAFNTTTGIPYNNLNFTCICSTDTTNGLATIGSLILEWSHLSDLLNDSTYSNLTHKAESYLLDPRYSEVISSSTPGPGLLGSNVAIDSGVFQDLDGGWVGGCDSYYEYLIKMYIYDPKRYGGYRDKWIEAADSTIEKLASHPSSRPEVTFLAGYNGVNLSYISEHLACFDGGNFLLAGSALNSQEYIDFGLSLTEGCHITYNSTLSGIGPELFSWLPNTTSSNSTSSLPQPPPNQESFYNTSGFWIDNPSYILRPEVVESYYYAYRITKDQKYQEYAWDAFLAINASCFATNGYAELKSVTDATPMYGDVQDSFFLAEVLKYLFLIFDEEQEYQVNGFGDNQWVFNTEAHPFKVRGRRV